MLSIGLFSDELASSRVTLVKAHILQQADCEKMKKDFSLRAPKSREMKSLRGGLVAPSQPDLAPMFILDS